MLTQRFLTTAASLLMLAAAQADVYMGVGVNKRHYQVNGLNLRFDGGELELLLRDGLIILDACVIQPQLFFFGPSIIPPCPLGATGLIAVGDVDRDGVRDDNQYWSVLTIIPAFLIEPSRPEIPQLFSAPPSKLPRPLQNFRDDSVVTFYDISTPIVRTYEQSRYELVRTYGSVRQIETAVAAGDITVAGDLRVVVTGSDIAGSPLAIAVPVLAGDTSQMWAQKVRDALAGTAAVTSVYNVSGEGSSIVLTEIQPDGNDPSLNISLEAGTAGGFSLPIPRSLNTVGGTRALSPASALKQMREELVPGQYVFTFPRLGNPDGLPVAIPVNILPNVEAVDPTSRTRGGFRFTTGLWDGDVYQMDPRVITNIRWQGNDRTVIRPGDQIYFSVLNAQENFITFPPTVPQSPILLPSPVTQTYTMPPFFFTVGEEGVMRLQYQRNLPSNGVAYDVSLRDFRAKVRMVDSYRGYSQITFPLGSKKNDMAAKGDIDRDGMSNLEEYAYQFPTNEDINATAREQFVPIPILAPPGLIEEFSRVVTKVPDPIVDPLTKPAGPSAPYLDADNHIVVDVPVRPRTGSTVRYAFQQFTPGRKKGAKVKIGTDWALTSAQVPSTVNVVMEVKILDEATRSILLITQRTAQVPVNLTQEILRLRSTNPVADPTAPLPDIRVVVSSSDLK